MPVLIRRHVVSALLLACTSLAILAVPDSSSAQEWQSPAWLMDPAEAAKFRREQNRNALLARQSVNPSGQQSDLLKRSVDWALSQMTVPDLQSNLPRNVIDRLLFEINAVNTSSVSRGILMEHVLERAPDLLAHPEPVVRNGVMVLVMQLNLKPGVPYNPAYKLFIEILQQPNQLQEIQIDAARGLTRLLRDGENAPSSVERSEIGTALVQALGNVPPSSEDGSWWLRYRLIEALGYVDRIDNVEGSPIVIDALLGVITDRKEIFINRAQAARSITRLNWPGSTNVPLITYEIMKLLGDVCAAQAKQPNSTMLRDAFDRIYLAFRPETRAMARDKNWGLLHQRERVGLGQHSALISSAWEAAFPVLKPFVENRPVQLTESAFKAVNDWVAQNAPSDRKVTPASQPLP